MSSTPVEVVHEESNVEIDHVFAQETPSRILEREYLISSGIVGAGTVSLYPLELYLALTQVQSFLKSFAFLKCGIKLRLMISSTPFSYGILVWNWMPNWNGDSAVFDMLNADPTFINLCGVSTTEFEIPYINVESAYVLGGTLTRRGPWVQFSAPLGVRTLNSTDSAPSYRLYCSLTNVKLFGAVAQSGRLQVAERSMSLSEMGSRAMVVRGDRSVAVRGIDQTGGSLVTTAIGAGVSTLAAAAPEVAIPVAAVLGAGKFIVETGKWLVESYNHYQGEEVQDQLIPQAEQQPSYVKQEPYGPMAACYLTPALSLASNRPKKIYPVELGDTELTHTVLGIARVPTISSFLSFNTNPESGTPVNIQHEPLTYFTGVHPSYYDIVCSTFRFWRGSIDYRLYFFTSPLVSAQFTLSYYNIMGGKLPTGTANMVVISYLTGQKFYPVPYKVFRLLAILIIATFPITFLYYHPDFQLPISIAWARFISLIIFVIAIIVNEKTQPSKFHG